MDLGGRGRWDRKGQKEAGEKGDGKKRGRRIGEKGGGGRGGRKEKRWDAMKEKSISKNIENYSTVV
jgi:hypothetical protein